MGYEFILYFSLYFFCFLQTISCKFEDRGSTAHALIIWRYILSSIRRHSSSCAIDSTNCVKSNVKTFFNVAFMPRHFSYFAIMAAVLGAFVVFRSTYVAPKLDIFYWLIGMGGRSWDRWYFVIYWFIRISHAHCAICVNQMAFGPESLVKISLVNRGVKKQHLSLISRLCDIVLPTIVRQIFCCQEVTLNMALDAMKYRYDDRLTNYSSVLAV